MKNLPEDFFANINKMSDTEAPIVQPQADKPIQSGKTLDFEAIRKSLDEQQAPIQTAAPEGVISSTAGFVGGLGRKAIASTAGLATRAVGFLGEAPARIVSSYGRDIGIVQNILGVDTGVGKKIKEFGDVWNQSQYETTREAVENIDWFWKNNMKDVVEEANNDPQGMLEIIAYVPKEGLKAIADNAGNFIAGKTLPAPIAFFAMTASERGDAIDKMVDNGVDFDIANKWGTLYGLASGGVEYWETVGQLGIAGLKRAGIIKGDDKFNLLNVTPLKKILEKQFSKQALNVLGNLSTELLQTTLQEAARSRAIAEHNKRNPDKQIEFESTIFEDLKKAGLTTLMMDAMLTAFGLGISYLSKRSSAAAIKDIELQSKSLDVSTKIAELVPNKSTSDMTPEEVRQGIVNLSRHMDKTSAMKVVAADPASRPDVIEEIMFPEGRKDRIAKIDEINKQTELVVQQEKQVEERNAFVEQTKQELAKDGTLDSVFKDPVAFDKLIEADSGGEIAAGTLSDKERQDMAKTIYDIYGLKPEENVSARLDEMLKEESDAGVKISSKERKADLLAEFPYAQDAVNEVLKQRSEAAKASKTVVEEESISPRKKKIQEALAKKTAESATKATETTSVQPVAAVETPEINVDEPVKAEQQKATLTTEKTGEVLRTQGDKPGTVDVLVKSAGIEAPRNKDEGIRVAKELLKKQDTYELTVEDINSLKQNQVTAILKASGAGKDIYSMGSRQVKDKALELLGITKKAAPRVAGPDIVQAGQVRIRKDGSRIEIGERVGDTNKFNVKVGGEQKQLSVGELGTYETEDRLKVRTDLRDAIKPNGGKIDYTDIEGAISGKDAQRKFGKDFNLVDENGDAITSKSSVAAIRSAVARELGVETTEAGQKSPESPKRLIEMLESEADGDVTFGSISDAADKILANRGDYSLTDEGVFVVEMISDNMERFQNDELNEEEATANLKKILKSAQKTNTRAYEDEEGNVKQVRESLGKDVARAIDLAIRGGSSVSIDNPNISSRVENQVSDIESSEEAADEEFSSSQTTKSTSAEKYITNVMEKTQSEAGDEEIEEASTNLRELVVKEAATRPDILKAIKESGSRTRVFEIASDLLGEKKMDELSAQAVNMVVGDGLKERTTLVNKSFNKTRRDVDDLAEKQGYNFGPVYHGTDASESFSTFSPSKKYGNSFFFSKDESVSKTFGKNVRSFYLSIKDPQRIKYSEYSLDSIESAADAGFDGLIATDESGVDKIVVVFDPSQAKSESDIVGDVKFQKTDETINSQETDNELVSRQEDNAYIETAKRAKTGDPVAVLSAQEMVDNAARKAGYGVKRFFHGTPFGNFLERAKRMNVTHAELMTERDQNKDLLKELREKQRKLELERSEMRNFELANYMKLQGVGRPNTRDIPDYSRRDLEFNKSFYASVEALDKEIAGLQKQISTISDKMRKYDYSSKLTEEDVFSRTGANDSGYLGSGYYFFDQREKSMEYAKSYPRSPDKERGEIRDPYVYEVYLKMPRPFIIGETKETQEMADYEMAVRKKLLAGGNNDIDDISAANSLARTRMLKNFGFDGVIGESRGKEGVEYVVFDSSQIKSAEPVTYDNDGNIVPLSKRFDINSKDTRYQSSKKIDRQSIDKTVKQFESTVKSAGGKFTKGTGDVLGEATIGGTKIVLKSKPQIVTPDRQYASGYTVTKDGVVEIYVSERDGQITTLPHEIGHASYEMLSAKDRETLVNQFGDIAKNNTEDLMKKVEEQYSKNKNIGARAKLAVVRLYRNFAKLVNAIAGRNVFNENKSASEILTDLGNGRVMAEFNAISPSKTKSIAEQFQRIDERADKSINKVIDQQEKLKAPTTISEIRKAVIAQYGSFKEAEKAMKKGKFDSISKMLASNMSAPPKSGFTKEASNLVEKGIKKQIDAGRKEIKHRSYLGRSAAGRAARWYREHQSHFVTILESVAGKDASGVALRQIADGRNKEASIKLDATAILEKTRGLTKAANLGRKDFIKDHNQEQVRGFTAGHRVQLASHARSAFLDRLIGLDTAGIKAEIKKIALEQARGDETLAKQYSKAIEATVYSLMGSQKTIDGKKQVVFDPDMPRSYFIKTRSGTHEYKFTARELNHVYRTLGNEQKAWIEGVQDKIYAMTGVRLNVAYEGNNNRSLRLLPIYIPQVKNYTPETREQKITEGSVENPMTHSTMRETLIAMDADSLSAVHSRKYSDSGLMMIPAQELLMKHVNDTASYVGMDKFFNEWKSALDDNKDQIIKYFGDDAYNTIKVEIINAEGVKDTSMKIYEKIANSIVGRRSAVVLKDIFVMMYQPISAIYYGRYFGMNNFGKALKDLSNPATAKDIKEVRKYAAALDLRYKQAMVETPYFSGKGYYGKQFEADSKTDNVVSKLARFTDKGMAKTDKIAIDIGIATALNYVRKNNPELRGEDLYREAATQASMASHMTQVSGDPLFMSELRQSKNIIPRTISYMTGSLSAAFNMVSRDITAAYRDPSPENIKNLATTATLMLAETLAISFIKHARRSLLGRGAPDDEWLIWDVTKGMLEYFAGVQNVSPFGEALISGYAATIADNEDTKKVRQIRSEIAAWRAKRGGPYETSIQPVVDLFSGIDGMVTSDGNEDKLKRAYLKTASAVWRIGDMATKENTFGWANTVKDFMDANGLTETNK